MHALIINGSPRIKKYSNTDKILSEFTEGMRESGATFEQFEVSNRRQWDTIREKFETAEHILIAIPLYFECIPGLLVEFLETLTPRSLSKSTVPGDVSKKPSELVDECAAAKKPTMSFILQGGFGEGAQLRCGEAYLKILAGKLGCNYGGTLVKGDNFSIRFDETQRDRVAKPYREMGRIYGRDSAFESEECKAFTGPEIFPAYIRLLVGVLFKTVVKKGFNKMAADWGCTRPLTDRPYESK
ncbi:MAG: NAD(P)H-dependent oxidoreductase [Clostridiales bacterium]|nr:NAD(P)H-dependent oxidoreductase [Clostridiales bacterium]